jgi:hypothetical protein
MTPQALTMELYVSPMKERNEDKYGHLTDQCICCFKPMKEGEKLFIHMNTIGMAVNPNIVTEENCKELTGAESQGCFPVGNDCAKKMKGFTFLMS